MHLTPAVCRASVKSPSRLSERSLQIARIVPGRLGIHERDGTSAHFSYVQACVKGGGGRISVWRFGLCALAGGKKGHGFGGHSPR